MKLRDCELCKHANTDETESPCNVCDNSSEFELYEYKEVSHELT